MITDTDNPAQIEQLCSAIRYRLGQKLRMLSSEEEKNALLGSALYDYADAVFPALSLLAAAPGTDSKEYRAAQVSALDLLTWISIPFIRSCSNHSVAVRIFEEIQANCPDEKIRQKLVTYTNQVKSQWNRVESGGIIHNPRAAKRLKREAQHSWQAYLLSIVFLAVGGAAIFSLDLVKVLFGRNQQELAQQALRHENATHAENVELSRPAPTGPIPLPESVAAPSVPPLPETGIYKFTDKNGVINIVDSADKVPPQYRPKVAVVKGNDTTTPVRIIGNQVLVPVTLQNNGRVVQTLLVLDTGCSSTVISEELAARLEIDLSRSIPVTARVADGRSVGARRVRLDRLAVGARGEAPCEVDVMGHAGARENHEGLLGMNFLREHQYRLDFKRSVIVWM